MKLNDLTFILGIPLCVGVIIFFSRISWQFYKETDKLNRRLLGVFVGSLGFMVLVMLLAIARILPAAALAEPGMTGLMSIAALIACGALYVLIARELWSVYQKVRLLRAVNTLAEPGQ